MKTNRKAKLKPVVDILMTLALLFLMGYQIWGEAAHEWAGAVMLILFIAHHVLNAGWYKNLGKGRYTAARVLITAVDLALLFVMLCLMASGIMMSRHVFAFLPIRAGMGTARLMHMSACYWGFVLMSFHLGLHWGMMMPKMRKLLKLQKPSGIRSTILRIIGALIAVYGLYVFINRDLITYMFLKTQFVFLDFNESPFVFYAEYLAMAGLFIWMAYYLAKILRKTGAKAGNKQTI